MSAVDSSSPSSPTVPACDTACSTMMDVVERHTVGCDTREWLITPRQCPSFAKPGIFLAGWSEAHTGFDFLRLRFPGSQALFCTDGLGEVLVEGRWHSCGPGTVYLTPPQVLHAYRAVPGKAWGVCWLTYHTPVVTLPTPMLTKANASLIAFLLRQLRSEAMGTADTAVLESWTQLVHTQVLRHVADARSHLPSPTESQWSFSGGVRRSMPVRLTPLWEQVALHPEYPWDIARLAEIVEISGEHLRRLCQQELGCSPMQQVTRIRIAQAATLLAQGNTLSAVAAQVGYSNPFVLSNVFHRVMGIRPSKYAAAKTLPEYPVFER